MRRFFVGLCLFLGVLLVVVGNISNSLRHQLLDTKTFVNTANEIVQAPPVQAAVTKQVSDAVFAQPQVQQAINAAETEWLPKELATFKPQIDAGIQQGVNAVIGYVVGSDVFEKVYTTALTATQERLVSGQGLTFDVGDVKKIVGADKASGLVGQAVALIPDDVASVSLLNAQQTQQLNQAISLLKNLWWWSWLLGLIFLGVAIGISHRRLKTIRALGITLGVVALVFILLFTIARGQVLAAVPAANRAVVQTVWDVVVPPFITRMIWLVVLAAITIIVTSLWGRLGLVAATRRAFTASRAKVAEARAHAAAKGAVATATTGGGTALAATDSDGGVAVTAEGVPVTPQKVGWRERVDVFVHTIDFHAALGGAAARVNRSLQIYRGAGVVVAALILLLLPKPTTSVLIWILALLVLYLGGIELLLGLGGQKKTATVTAAVTDGGTATASVEGGDDTAPTVAAVHGKKPAPPAAAPAAEAAAKPTVKSGVAAPLVQPAPEPAVPAIPTSDRIDLLERLGAAKNAGFLTSEEFDEEKHRLLAS